MRFLLDTNIVVDIISKRLGYEDSLQLFKYCELGQIEGFVSTTTVTDVMYILRKHIEPNDVRDAVQTLLLIVDVASVLKSDISSAFKSEMKDFEDAVQSSCAERIKADYIVTHNLKDFEKSTVAAISPSKALKVIRAK
jgi:predicted nucleic acid-binding protein